MGASAQSGGASAQSGGPSAQWGGGASAQCGAAGVWGGEGSCRDDAEAPPARGEAGGLMGCGTPESLEGGWKEARLAVWGVGGGCS